MKTLGFSLLLLLLAACQGRPAALDYEPNSRYPFGRVNPDAPPELAQFSFMIGKNDCVEQRLDNSSGEWVEGRRTWDAHYYMNGFAIRDSGRSGGTTNGNIRIFDTTAGEWAVTFFSTPVYGSGTWRGKQVESEIVLRQRQKAPGTDLDGFSTLTFTNISPLGFDWSGEWISEDGSFVFPYWRIQCQKAVSS